MKKTVKNLYDYARDYEYIVVNIDFETGDRWFYGAWDTLEGCREAIEEVDFREVLRNEEIDWG